MFKRLSQERAQSTAEYVIVLGLIVAAVVAMQTYIKRGFQARIKDAVDYAGPRSAVVTFSGNQYEPYYLSSNFESTHNLNTGEELLSEGTINRSTNQDTRTRNGEQIFANIANAD